MVEEKKEEARKYRVSSFASDRNPLIGTIMGSKEYGG